MEHEMTAGAGPLGSGEDVMRDGGRSTRTGEQLGSEHQPASTPRHLLADTDEGNRAKPMSRFLERRWRDETTDETQLASDDLLIEPEGDEQ